MKTTSTVWPGLPAAALCALLAAPASAQLSTTANGPYYAAPSWNQKLATNRFVVLANWNNEAVLDRETGLVWARTPGSTFHNWFQAHFICNQTTVGGRKGWRLPSLAELSSLVDPSVPSPGPVLPAGHPFTAVDADIYWSASTGGSSGTTAWALSLAGGDVGNLTRNSAFLVWCVRGGSAAGIE